MLATCVNVTHFIQTQFHEFKKKKNDQMIYSKYVSFISTLYLEHRRCFNVQYYDIFPYGSALMRGECIKSFKPRPLRAVIVLRVRTRPTCFRFIRTDGCIDCYYVGVAW